jgi:hypothetical protein
VSPAGANTAKQIYDWLMRQSSAGRLNKMGWCVLSAAVGGWSGSGALCGLAGWGRQQGQDFFGGSGDGKVSSAPPQAIRRRKTVTGQINRPDSLCTIDVKGVAAMGKHVIEGGQIFRVMEV